MFYVLRDIFLPDLVLHTPHMHLTGIQSIQFRSITLDLKCTIGSNYWLSKHCRHVSCFTVLLLNVVVKVQHSDWAMDSAGVGPPDMLLMGGERHLTAVMERAEVHTYRNCMHPWTDIYK